MNEPTNAWRTYGLPVAACIAVFCLANFLVNWWFTNASHSIPVYLIAGSFVPLAFLALAFRRGTLTAADVGLDANGWKPHRRLFGLALTLLLGYGGFATLGQHLDMDIKPSLDDYAFWFVFLLPASIAELMVFIVIGFCLPEKWLQKRGMKRWQATVLSAAFAGIAFGVYHYTHEPQWWEYALYPLIPVMWINLCYFSLSRNFYLTLVLHNAFAAVGFTQVQYLDPENMNPDFFRSSMPLNITAFVIPFLILHVMEWRIGSGGCCQQSSSDGGEEG